MDEVKCIGTEETLEDCPHVTKDDCGGTEGAGVICSSNKKWIMAIGMFISPCMFQIKFPLSYKVDKTADQAMSCFWINLFGMYFLVIKCY